MAVVGERPCQNCGATVRPVPIVYGLPSHDAFEQQERGELLLGGCVVTGDDAQYACPNCGQAMQEHVQEKNDPESGPADTTADGPFQLPTDVDDIGFSTVLLASVPLLRALVQMVAESDGDWNYLNLVAPSGAWVGVARRDPEDFLVVSTNHGGRTTEPYTPELDTILVGHKFQFDAEHEGYRQFVRFDSDVAFTELALLIIGTFMHAWGTPLKTGVSVELQLSLPPTGAAVA